MAPLFVANRYFEGKKVGMAMPLFSDHNKNFMHPAADILSLAQPHCDEQHNRGHCSVTLLKNYNNSYYSHRILLYTIIVTLACSAHILQITSHSNLLLRSQYSLTLLVDCSQLPRAVVLYFSDISAYKEGDNKATSIESLGKRKCTIWHWPSLVHQLLLPDKVQNRYYK